MMREKPGEADTRRASTQCSPTSSVVAASVPHNCALPVSARLRFDPMMIETTMSSADHLPKIRLPAIRTSTRP